jgi:hypothetical protein
MDILSAFSGLERIAIIGGAMLVGFWGYRLLATDRTPALVFMGIACAVLFGALITGGSHVKNVGESFQLATASDRNDPAVTLPEPEMLDVTTLVPEALDESADATVVGTPAKEVGTPTKESAAASTPPTDLEMAVDNIVVATAPSPVIPDVSELLSSHELGGRIVSVKSDAITLEWSPAEG